MASTSTLHQSVKIKRILMNITDLIEIYQLCPSYLDVQYISVCLQNENAFSSYRSALHIYVQNNASHFHTPQFNKKQFSVVDKAVNSYTLPFNRLCSILHYRVEQYQMPSKFIYHYIEPVFLSSVKKRKKK